MIMRRTALWALLTISVCTLTACASFYGGRFSSGKIIVESSALNQEVFFLTDTEYRAIEPLIPSGGAVVRAQLLQRAAPQQAGGVIIYDAGSYQMVYTCGERVVATPVQILDVKDASEARRLRADCQA